MTAASPYRDRDARAAHLAGERPHASEILELYRLILARQEPLYERALALHWADGGLAGLPWERLDAPFRRFVDDLAAVVPPDLGAAGRALAAAPAEVRREVLERTLAIGELGEVTGSLGLELLQVTFWSRAFLEPLAVAAAARTPRGVGEGTDEDSEPEARGACPHCGWPPQAAVVGDSSERRGGRSLVCALCANRWAFPRVRCPSCGESSSEALVVHAAEGLSHVRVDECTSCNAYWKAIDLRQDGRAVPVVEDLATPELDLWAAERDLWKLCRNLLAL